MVRSNTRMQICILLYELRDCFLRVDRMNDACTSLLKNLHYFSSFVELDFRFPIGAPIHGIRAFLSTNQLQVVLDSIKYVNFQFASNCELGT